MVTGILVQVVSRPASREQCLQGIVHTQDEAPEGGAGSSPSTAASKCHTWFLSHLDIQGVSDLPRRIHSWNPRAQNGTGGWGTKVTSMETGAGKVNEMQ